MNSDRFGYLRIASSTSIASGSTGVLHAIIPTDASGSLTVYDGADTSGTLLYGPTRLISGSLSSILFDCNYYHGLYVVISGGLGPVTVIYK